MPQSQYDRLNGVIGTSVGYTGGTNPQPTYKSVCRNDGHTEALRVEFDPNVLSYEDIVRRVLASASEQRRAKVQYMNAIWPQNQAQQKVAKRVATELGKEGVPILAKADWHDAEDYHQKYYDKQSVGRRGQR